MTNILPLLMTLMMASKGGSGSLESLSPLLSAFGLSPQSLGQTGGLGDILKGNLSAEKLLPLIMNMMNASHSGNAQPSPAGAQKTSADGNQTPPAPNYLKPISNLADTSVNYALSHYFANN